jgi:hypothetical protein
VQPGRLETFAIFGILVIVFMRDDFPTLDLPVKAISNFIGSGNLTPNGQDITKSTLAFFLNIINSSKILAECKTSNHKNQPFSLKLNELNIINSPYISNNSNLIK